MCTVIVMGPHLRKPCRKPHVVHARIGHCESPFETSQSLAGGPAFRRGLALTIGAASTPG